MFPLPAPPVPLASLSPLAQAAPLAVGDPAPDVSSVDQDGKPVNFKDVYAKGPTLVYFYPKADTPGCTMEGKNFSKLAPAFSRAGTAILGVSADPVPKQGKFKAKHDLSIMLASDESHQMLEAYGVWAKKSMWGRSYMGILRNTYLIGPDGRIARIWEKVKVAGHAEEVLQAAKEL